LPTSYQKQDEVGNCQIATNDSLLDVVLQFDISDVIQALQLGSFPGGAIVPLIVTGNLRSGGSFSSLKGPDFLRDPAFDFVTLLSPKAPVVTILPSNDITLTAPNTAITLTAKVSSRSQPHSSFQWCKERGLGEVAFQDPTQQSSIASFDIAGEYLITSTAAKEHFSGQDSARVTVNLNPNGDFQAQAITDLIDDTKPADHPDDFLTYSVFSQGTPDTAANYYAAIDPQNLKTTLTDWLRENGMLNDPDLTKAYYSNAVDLGFGRRMEMAGSRRAFVVTNYRTVDDTIDDVNPIAAVAMEYSPAADPVTGKTTVGNPFTKFYVFDGKTGNRRLSADLDGGGEKSIPGLCIVCHGGGTLANYQTVQGFQRGPGDVHAHFLPFDLNAFDYSCDPHFTRAAQEGAFKRLNQGVLEIEAGTATSPANRDLANNIMTPLITLIEGWYGATFTVPAPTTLPRATQDSAFVPPAWNINTASADLYTHVVARSCRTCHVTRPEGSYSMGSPTDFNNLGLAQIKNAVFGATTNLTSLPVTVLETPGPIMPHARRTFERFWLSTSPAQPEILRDYLLSQGLP
jgi:hypothetical protein